MNASFAIQLLPSVEREKLLPVVDEVIAYIQSHGLKTVVGPFETVIEGDFDQLIEILRGCCKVCVEGGWIIVRFSGTEPRVRVFAEMATLQQANDLVKIMADFAGLPFTPAAR